MTGGQPLSVSAPERKTEVEQTEMKEFMLVVRRALLLIVKWIEKTYIV